MSFVQCFAIFLVQSSTDSIRIYIMLKKWILLKIPVCFNKKKQQQILTLNSILISSIFELTQRQSAQ